MLGSSRSLSVGFDPFRKSDVNHRVLPFFLRIHSVGDFVVLQMNRNCGDRRVREVSLALDHSNHATI